MKIISRLKNSSMGFRLIMVSMPLNVLWLATPYDIPTVIRFLNGFVCIIGIMYYLTDNGDAAFRRGLDGFD